MFPVVLIFQFRLEFLIHNNGMIRRCRRITWKFEYTGKLYIFEAVGKECWIEFKINGNIYQFVWNFVLKGVTRWIFSSQKNSMLIKIKWHFVHSVFKLAFSSSSFLLPIFVFSPKFHIFFRIFSIFFLLSFSLNKAKALIEIPFKQCVNKQI